MVKISKIMKVALVLIGLRMGLFLIKIIFGLLINSVALIADAIHSGADFVVAFGLIIGIQLSERRPSEKFPYGFHKSENLIELFIALGIFYAGYTILMEAIQKFGGSQTTDPSLGLLITIISLGISIYLIYYLHEKGKETNSPMFLAEVKDIRVDIFATLLVFIGFGGYYFGISILEPIAGIIIAFFIFITGLQIFLHATKVLLDAVMNYEQLNAIRELIEAHTEVKAVQTLHARSAGRYCFLEIEILTSLKLLKKAHELTEKLEAEIQKEFPTISKINIHIEPEKKEYTRIAIPLQENEGLQSKISPHFGSAKYFFLYDYKEGKSYNFNFLSNPFLYEEKRKGILVADWLASKEIDKIIIKEPLKGGGKLAIEKHLIEMELTDHKIIEEILQVLK
ncbi:MAG: cation diffusion facilitator family transporter [Candidatus Helarchaeota archaeon]